MIEFLVIVEKGKSSYGAYMPDLPGCVAVGSSRREVMQFIREGIELHINALRKCGEAVPVPATRGEVIRISAT